MLLKEYNKNTSCLFLGDSNCKILKKLNCDNCKFFKSKDDKREQKLQKEYNIKLGSNMTELQLIYEIKRRGKNL